MEDRPSNVVLLNGNSTILNEELANQLLWTEDRGRGWKSRPITSSDSQFLTKLEAEIADRNRPTDRVTLIAVLARLANAIGGDRSAESWKMMFDDYAEDLNGISEAHLREIVAKHRRSSNWFPKPAELVELWNFIKYTEAEKWRRARVLLGHEKPKPWEAA